MKIAILGAGFTGLTAALRLVQQGHQVILIEKEPVVGGLAMGFKRPGWDWTLEKAYHHWFTNDTSALNLAQQLNHRVIIKRPKTDVYTNRRITTFDSPLSLLFFHHLPLLDKVRTGLVILYLKLTGHQTWMESQLALSWVRKYMGNKVTNLLWEPLFRGKFGDYKDQIILSWFWARIKKRTTKLAYPEKGFKSFAEEVAKEVQHKGGKLLLNTAVSSVDCSNKHCRVKTATETYSVDKIISTLPSPLLAKLVKGLPAEFIQRVTAIPHLHASNLILILKKPFFANTYWLNITDTRFPFLVMAEHTNFMEARHYNNEHLLYIGNYLPEGHRYLKMTAAQLLKEFDPYLRQINPEYQSSLVDVVLFTAPFAQPVVTRGYKEKIPQLISPFPNLYIANMDMVYPWDRGTNYAIEMGEKVAALAGKKNEH